MEGLNTTDSRVKIGAVSCSLEAHQHRAARMDRPQSARADRETSEQQPRDAYELHLQFVGRSSFPYARLNGSWSPSYYLSIECPTSGPMA